MNLKEWQVEITKVVKSKGFTWKKEEVDTMLLRIISEIIEASEALRDNDYNTFAEELADTFIRLANCAEVMGVDLEKEVFKKHKKNMDRPYLHGRKKK